MILTIGEKSEFFSSDSSMSPNSDETPQMGQLSFIEEAVNKEKLRPPIYNPEDYGIMLKKWGKKSATSGLVSLYAAPNSSDSESGKSRSNSFRDYRNPMHTSSGSEMTLRQFGTVSELLAKLRSDLRLAFPSFVQEFVSDPLDGVTLLLDLLRAIQLSQSSNLQGQPGSANTTGKIPPSVQRKALLDELSCLQCLLNCCLRYSEAIRKLTTSSAGLFTLAICIMSNVNKSRIIALSLLTKACDPTIGGHSAVSEAMSTLRLRFGEPVRFRFLVGMLTSTGGQKELIAAGVKFLNKFLDTAGSKQKRLYVQAELEQAGFDTIIIRRSMEKITNKNDPVYDELKHFEQNHIDIETLSTRLENAERDSKIFKEKFQLLERRVQILQEEKGILINLEQCLKDRCSELQEEVESLKSEKSQLGSYDKRKRPCRDSTPNEDEGISSSERSLTPEELQKEPAVFGMYNIQNQTLPVGEKCAADDDEEETTIDEVIEELRNIINDAETEDYHREQRELEKERKITEEAQVAGKLKTHMDIDDYVLECENEIVPAVLHPQPPRRAKSLVHLFVPSEDFYCYNKELFFENHTPYTSEDSSDSLLSASRYHLPRIEKEARPKVSSQHSKVKTFDRKFHHAPSYTNIIRTDSFRAVEKAVLVKNNSFDGVCYYTSSSPVTRHKERRRLSQEIKGNVEVKCKSLERIDAGLGSLVDIVVTNQSVEKIPRLSQHRSEAGSNVTTTMISRSFSNVIINPSKQETRSKLSTHSDEKQRMFLPFQKDSPEVSYYFPRLQEKRNNSNFLVKRGHTNAGLYSGQISDNNVVIKTKEYQVTTSNNCQLLGKVTDLPSGLY